MIEIKLNLLWIKWLVKEENHALIIRLNKPNIYEIRNENDALRKKVEYVDETLSKFVQGKKHLDMNLPKQRSVMIRLDWDVISKKQKKN